jgi:photosystem II stability/assembly factor-like uncharacterized protein
MKKVAFLFFLSLLFLAPAYSQRKKKQTAEPTSPNTFAAEKFNALEWRCIGPFRGGRSNAAVGVPGDPLTYYFGSTGGGVWKTTDAGTTWKNISDGFFKTGSVGAIAVAPSDHNVIYVGMGEHAVRGVMTSHGDGMYRSTDAGKTWKHIGLPNSMHIAAIRIHPNDPDHLYVAVQGSVYTASEDRGVYRSKDGGQTWEKVLFVNEHTGAADLSMDANNPRILYAGMWDHQRLPWQIRSGGEGSGIFKSTDGGTTWKPLEKGLPELMGKVSVDVSPADSDRLYANIEAEGKEGGVYRSDDGGQSWTQTNSDRVTVARAWYYIEVFADPQDKETVYVLNAPMLKSIDGGRTFQPISNPHSDQHDLWINPDQPNNMILANDGGACVTFNGGQTWSTQGNQPTAQFYRVIADEQFPYHVYGGQQDNSTVAIASKTISGGISERDWYPVGGGESAFIAFNDPKDPHYVYGTSIQGFIDVWDKTTRTQKDIMAYPAINLGSLPKDQKYRWNWNGPLIHNRVNPQILYHGGNLLLRSEDGGLHWDPISPDLTRNDSTKHGAMGIPFTNEAAGGEVYNTISYIASSPHDAQVIWVGSDDGLVHLTKDEGKTWTNVSPPVEGESLINAIEVSPHDPARAYLAVTRYKFGDQRPMIYMTEDFGASWTTKIDGLPDDVFVRVVREDPKAEGLLYAGTERGVFVSFNNGQQWHAFQSNLPVCPITDLYWQDNDLIAATSGRALWILDDVGALQQSKGNVDTTMFKLFAPKTTVKFTLGGGPDGKGKNPAPGVTLDYYVPHDFVDTLEVTLQVLDDRGQVIRTYSNQKDEEFKTWPGGPTPPTTIPSKPGLNRTNWDLRRDGFEGVAGVRDMGGYAGAMVGPGIYTLRLEQDSLTWEQTVEVKADPRLDDPAEAYAQQQQMIESIDGAVRAIHGSVNRLRSVRSQLQERLSLMKGQDELKELIELGGNAVKALEKWENELIQPKQETFQDVINFENQLTSELIMLLRKVDGYRPQPTGGMEERLDDLEAEWQVHKTEMDRIIREELEAFSKKYKEANLPILILPESGGGA